MTITETQFKCGPEAARLPDDDGVLRELTTQELLGYYFDAWNWGYRCSDTNVSNYEYLKDAIERRERALQELQQRKK